MRLKAIAVGSCMEARRLVTTAWVGCSPNSKHTLSETRRELINCGHFLDIVAHFSAGTSPPAPAGKHVDTIAWRFHRLRIERL
jgi:hypothetical protein